MTLTSTPYGVSLDLPPGWHLDNKTLRALAGLTPWQRREVLRVWREAQRLYDQINRTEENS